MPRRKPQQRLPEQGLPRKRQWVPTVPNATICQTGKKRYISEGKARLDLLRAQAQMTRKGRDHVPTRCYLCPYCNGWHMTSMRPREEERPR